MIVRVLALWLLVAAGAGFLATLQVQRCHHPAFDAAADARRVAAIPPPQLLSRPAQSLVDPARQAQARCVGRYGRMRALLELAAALLAPITLLLLRWDLALARVLPHAPRIRRYALIGALLALWLWAWGLPFDVAGVLAARGLGLSRETLATFLSNQAASLGLGLVAAAIVAQAIGVLRRRWWSLWFAAALAPVAVCMAVVVPLWIAPLFNAYHPFPQTPLRSAIEQQAARAGLRRPQIFVADLSAQREAANAFVFGFWKTERIVVGDTLLARYGRDDVLFVLAHEMGHAVHGDVYRGVAWAWLFAAAGLVATELLEPRRRRSLPPESRVPALLAIAVALSLAVQPIGNAISRGVEHRADAFALRLNGDRAAGVRTFVRFADEDLAQPCPPRWAALIFATHPPIGARIAFMQGREDPCR
ncbi:MAG: M48 family metalloprotease [bacterium]|nr:M48 family metalloprotease [bacterium]